MALFIRYLVFALSIGFGLLIKEGSFDKDSIYEWHCENEYIKQIVEDALTQYSPDVDLIQQYVTSEMEAYLLESQTQWIMTAIKIERSVSFIDDNAEKSQWFCSMYDQETSIRVNVIRIYNANEFSRSRRLSVLKHSL